MVPGLRGDAVVPPVRTSAPRAERALRVTEAFPRRPAPRHTQPSPEQIKQACEDFALHIPSLVHVGCLADGCDEDWPCPPYKQAVPVLERAGLIDVDGKLRQR